MLRPPTLWLWRSPWIRMYLPYLHDRQIPYLYDRQIMYFLRDLDVGFRTPFVLTCSTCKSQWQDLDEVKAMTFGSFIKYKPKTEDLSRPLSSTRCCYRCNCQPRKGQWQHWRIMDGGQMSMTDFANMSTRHYARDINTRGFTNLIWCLLCSDCLPLWSDWDES